MFCSLKLEPGGRRDYFLEEVLHLLLVFVSSGLFFFFVGLHSKDDTDQVNGVSKMTDTVGVNVCKLLPFNVSYS